METINCPVPRPKFGTRCEALVTYGNYSHANFPCELKAYSLATAVTSMSVIFE